jgi:hypothetical protein
MMKKLSTLRIATYVMLVAIFVLLRSDRKMFAVFLPDPDLPDAAADAEIKLKEHVEKISAILNSPGFLASKRNGAELMQIATTNASEHRRNINEFRDPHVQTKIIDSRFYWILSFARKYPDGYLIHPEENFTVTIDDESGIATFEDTSARM